SLLTVSTARRRLRRAPERRAVGPGEAAPLLGIPESRLAEGVAPSLRAPEGRPLAGLPAGTIRRRAVPGDRRALQHGYHARILETFSKDDRSRSLRCTHSSTAR